MITVKTAGYTEEDKKLLHTVLDNGLKSVTSHCDTQCEACSLRKVCTDVSLVLSYPQRCAKVGE